MELDGAWAGPDYIIDHENIRLEFSRIHEDRAGEHTAMLRVFMEGYPGYGDGDLFDGKIVLSGPRSKADAVKALGTRLREYPDWYGLIEKACQVVRRVIEDGDPPINLGTVDRPPRLRWLIEPLFREGEHSMLYGPGGSGKSLFCLSMLCCLAHGADYIGFNVGEPIKVLYLDYEDSWETHASRLDLLNAGLFMGVTPEIIHKEATAPLASSVQPLARLIAKEGIELVVVDSAGAACGADPEKAESALGYFRGLKSLGVKSSVTIAHHSKADDAMPFGSVFWWNSMRNIWLTKLEREENNELHLGLFHRKVNNGALQRPQGLRIKFGEDEIVIDREDLRDVPAMLDEMDSQVRIETAIRNYTRDHQRGPDRETLQEEVGTMKPGTFRQGLARLTSKNRIQVLGGLYQLLYKPAT